MLSKQEEDFLTYWQLNSSKEKNNPKYVVRGILFGLIIAATLLIFINSGWYERATMEANAKFSPVIFSLIIIIIAAFAGFFYKNYQYERYEQQYLEILAKKKKQQKNAANKPENLSN